MKASFCLGCGMAGMLAQAPSQRRHRADNLHHMPICEEHIACIEAVQHASGAVAVIGLSRAQLQGNGQAIGIDQGMYPGCQPAA